MTVILYQTVRCLGAPVAFVRSRGLVARFRDRVPVVRPGRSKGDKRDEMNEARTRDSPIRAEDR